MDVDSLHDLFVYELRGAYYLEDRLVAVLDAMAAGATNERIATAFDDHREETTVHVERLRDAFDALDREVSDRTCRLVDALDEDRRAAEEHFVDDDLLNLWYLGAGLKAERIEITTYDRLLGIAERLDFDHAVVEPLEDNRSDEIEAVDQLQGLVATSDLQSLWERLTS